MTTRPAIRVRGARQNNLRGIDLDLPLGELHVVTGVSGSGKSSLAFDTVYSEGQRRYVETFSSYARQFLDRMDKPRFDDGGGIDGIPPSIAIDQTNPVRTSRSTVGTMTELNDHLKLLFARAAVLHCRGCGAPVRRDTPQSIMSAIRDAGLDRIMVTFDIAVPAGFTSAEIVGLLAGQGYTRVHREHPERIEVIADRLRLNHDNRLSVHPGSSTDNHPDDRPGSSPENGPGSSSDNRARAVEAIENALKAGRGRLTVYRLDAQRRTRSPRRFSTTLHCAGCDIEYREPVPSMFSFNSPLGACETCRGFGRTMGIDYGLVVPDESKTLREGAIRPWQSKSYRQCQRDLVRYARRLGVALDRPWRELDDATREWVLEGEAEFDEDGWYGVRRFFDWLETKSYRMHIRVLLSRYRAYRECPACHGARLKPQALLWRIGTRTGARKALGGDAAHRPPDAALDAAAFAKLPGLCIHDVMRLPLDRCRRFFDELRLRAPLDDATELLLAEIRGRLAYLVEVGLGYLTLDRQSRTLSGGEVQRINLTTALGTSLVNTLFVLDEPSIGLHARDIARIVSVLHKLREAGNTLLVVEHDPQIMLAADRIIDMGPGPGERGGEIVFRGTPRALLRSRRSLTAAWLRGERQIEPRAPAPTAARRADGAADPIELRGPAPTPAPSERIEIRGARAHNLADIDVDLPLRRFVCVTGVSGSGKSTLAVDVLYRAACKRLGRAVEAPGAHRTIHGLEALDDVVLVDQSPIGKTTRSNPASYVGALDAIRKRFAAEPIAVERGYTAGTFSFNSGNGRCPSCGGNGFEHVEMQFLSDVYLRCPDCDGRRYRNEVLDVKIRPQGGAGVDTGCVTGSPRSIADVLEMTVEDALAFFAGRPDVARPLAPLAAVGLSYLRLGQPVPALSGGEAQRLKLARHLAARGAGHCLFIFDEPTTGLHLEDVSRLLEALDALLAAGHTVLVIEHHLDVIAAADWIVDLGPEGGSGGGRVVATGRPTAIARRRRSHTGTALRAHFAERKQGAAPMAPAPASKPSRRGAAISIRNAREHNLQGADIDIPRERFTVVTGVSGSGKSTVAFDILFAEGQRRYLESLNAYARQFVQPAARPDVDAIFGIPPSVAIEQRTSRGGYKSTVGTMTEIHHFLRLLFVRLGTQHCPECGIAIEPQTLDAIVARVLKRHRGRKVEIHAPLVVARKGYYTELARWAAKHGQATLRVDGVPLPTDAWPRLDRYREHDIDLPLGSISARADREPALRTMIEHALGHGAGRVRIADRRGETLYSTERACPGCGSSFDELDPRLFSYNSRHGWCPSCYGTGRELRGFDETETGEEAHWSENADEPARECRACAGRRLRPEALAVRYRSHGIADLSALDVETARKTLTRIKPREREAAIARDVLAELGTRLDFLCRLGLGYLRLDRSAPTLSGGEAQRIRLAAQLGSNLRGVCYILDEPTIGLHARDNAMLLDTLRALRAKGNTVVVVEHDEETIRSAEHIIDLGPGAGVNGGKIVAHGPIARILASPDSLTGRHLASPLAHPIQGGRSPERSKEPEQYLSIRGACLNNLQGIDVDLPLERLVCVTGVSGSGKSSLVRGVLLANLAGALRPRRRGRPKWTGCREIGGFEAVNRVLEVDQAPIGKTPRSCPATYVGIWDHIRRLFAGATESRIRGYGASRFSFNVAGGRCDACEGQGVQRIEMSFLPDVRVPCDACGGQRFTPETLEIRYLDMSIAEVLGASVDEALPRFEAHPRVHRTLALLHDVGLGYLTLGQSSPTLSGGEAQRIKLVTELAKVDASASRRGTGGSALYVLDEPTIGLHMADVEKLVRVLHRLVDAGNTVIVIEHNLDVVAEADTVIDLGPEGGAGGGRLVAAGTPHQVARTRDSHTAHSLSKFLTARQ